MLRPERPASIRLRPETRKNSASTATMPTTAAAPLQNSQRLRKTRQSRPSGWTSTEAARSGMVMRPLMKPPCRVRCSSISSAEMSPRAVLGGGAMIGAVGVGRACSGIGAGLSPPVGACRSVVSGTWLFAPPRPLPTSGTTDCTAGSPPAGAPCGPCCATEGAARATASARARSSGPPARRTSVVVRLIWSPSPCTRCASPRRRSRSRGAARAPCRWRR